MFETATDAVLGYLASLRTWEMIGWVAQGIFASRFLVQWVLSERAKRSYVPIVFWYLSLTGGTLMLFYALNIQAWPIVIGQLTGVVVYGRNLLLIYRERRTLAPSPGPFAGQVTFLYSADLERAHAFYADRLGLPLVLDQGDRRFYRASRDAAIGVCRLEGPAPDAAGQPPVTLMTADVDAWAGRLEAQGVTLAVPPGTDPQRQVRRCQLSDPDGHRIEVQSLLMRDWAVA